MSRILPLNKRGIPASPVVLGCMGFGGGWNQNPVTADDVKQLHAAVDAALEAGINMIDHADIYTFGKAEETFGKLLKERPELRDQLIVQSKCGIRLYESPERPQRFDFSKEHILRSVDGILSRLGLESLDILLLHRPDPLVEPEDVAEAFNALQQAGKVKNFGVSNMSEGQIRFLRTAVQQPLIVNQIEMSLLKLDWLNAVVHVNQDKGRESCFPEGTIEYCRTENIQLQAWSPLARGLFSGQPLDGQSETVRQTADLVGTLAEQKGTTREAIVLAFLLRHPAGIQPVIGTVNPQRIRACGEAVKVELSREEWYQLYVTSRGDKMP